MTMHGNLADLPLRKPFRVGRASSWDTSGRNRDAWRFEAGETKVLAELEGPGVISHIWCTASHKDPHYLRKLLLRMYWDGETNPSVEVPLGDFFGLGHGQVYSYQCAFFSTSTNYGTGVGGTQGPGVAMNAWIPMPFRQTARVELVNEQDVPLESFYFYIDYQLHQSLPDETAYLHAQWRRDNPCAGWTGEGSVWGSEAWRQRAAGPDGINKSDANNYLILEAEGAGHYVGVNLSIDRQSRGWWGEGDDMVFIDRDGIRHWPPDLHGTGSEDYLGHAWGMQNVAHLYTGQPWAEKADHFNDGKICVYRYHVVDPMPFERNLRISVEHGHANDRSDDIASVAYWYQTEPHKPFPAILEAALRVPNTI